MEEEDIYTHSVSKARIEHLGFKPQYDMVYNNLLPYAEQLDDESTEFFKMIKSNLAKSVMMKEMRPGCAMWTSKLMKYIKLYGLKFSKEDHIQLVYLVFELITIPDLEPTKLHKYSTLLLLLLKKRHLLSPEDLTIPWRPLYDLAEKIFSKAHIYHYSGKRHLLHEEDEDSDAEKLQDAVDNAMRLFEFLKMFGMELPFDMSQNVDEMNESLDATFEALVHYFKPYFPASASREILDELLPRFNPWCSNSQEVLDKLVTYLPCCQSPEHLDQGVRLWFGDFMNMWNLCLNAPPWEPEMLVLMSHVAGENIGYIDWEPHIPLMFNRFLRSFNLPVYFKNTQTSKHTGVDTHSMALWIVSVLSPKSSAQSHLDNFMTTVTTYLHSANSGRWSGKLRDLLRKLPFHFVNRVHMERSTYKKTWEKKVPDSHKLTDDDITKFVECMLNVALQAMFSRAGVNDACAALQLLGTLRPAMVVAPIIEKLWNTLDSLTEPHKLTCALMCAVAVARPLISGFTNGYPEGPTHVIPLLFSALPGLDPNDFKKTLVSLHFISVVCTFIPLVNCSGASEYYDDLTEEEHTVCEATAQLDDFVIQFFERVFILIESSIMEHTRMEQKELDSARNKLESASEGALASASITVLMQSSTDIFKMALNKFFKFVTERILEINVAGMTAASLARSFARVNAKETFKLFIPYLCDTIMKLLGDGEDVIKAETLDNDLLFNLLLLSHIVERDGDELIAYMPRLLDVLDRTLTLTCKEGYMLAASTLNYIITCLCSVHTQEFRSCTEDYDSGVKNFLAVREWGKAGNVWDCKLKWHTPNEREVQCIQSIINRYLPKELERIQKHMDGSCKLAREELHRCLSTIKALLSANPVLPPLEDEPLVVMDTNLPPFKFRLNVGINGSVYMPDGSNVRKAVATVMHELQKLLLDSSEDDTKNLCSMISIWDQLVSHSNFSNNQLESHTKAFSAVKKTLEDKLIGRPAHPRALLADRALLQHEFRAHTGLFFTKSHADIMKELVTLATSRYSAVRMAAQCRLNWMVCNYTYSFYIMIPQLLECLAVDPELEHDRFKGALYCLLGPKQTPVVARHDWKVISQLWPAILLSKTSEKPSAIRLLDVLVNSIQIHFPTITIFPKWSDGCMERAKALLCEEELNDPHFMELVAKSDDALKQCGEENVKCYNSLVEVLVHGAESTKLHWRHNTMCIALLPNLAHLDVKFPTSVVKMILNNLIHDSINMRRMAIKIMVVILKQRKRKHLQVEVDPFKMAGLEKPDNDEKLPPGFRPDNMWLQYDHENSWTEEKWDKTPYIHKPNYGFYGWPKPFKMYAPPSEQTQYEKPEDMEEGDRVVWEFFTNKDNVDKLIEFLCMEDKKGKDGKGKYNGAKFALFKRLFRNYGDAFLDILVPHLESLILEKKETHQRCAAEIIGGIFRGTKHWPYHMMERLKLVMKPIIESALQNMTTESISDWGTCYATSFERMDMSRMNWVLDVLSSGWEINAGGAGGLGGCLYALQAAITQHPWRGAKYSNKLIEDLKRQNMLSHPYQIVRERVASVLAGLYDVDMVFPGGLPSIGPSIEDMMKLIEPHLEVIMREGMEGISTNSNGTPKESVVDIPMEVDATPDDKPQTSKTAVGDIQAIVKSIGKDVLEKGKVSMTTVNKILNELKPNHRLDILKDSENAKLESMLSNEFLEENTDRIMNMLDDSFIARLKIDGKTNGTVESINGLTEPHKDSEYDIGIRFFKTALKWITSAVCRNSYGGRAVYYTLVPAACALSSKDGPQGDDELGRLCVIFLASLAQALHTPECLATALNTVKDVCESPSWYARASCLSFLQCLVFHNMALISTVQANREIVLNLVLTLLGDPRPEVRESAAQMMAGLLHCGIVEDQQGLLNRFKGMCKGKVVKGPGASDALIKRHCGVLGLCSFIAAHPYSVPPYLPEIFLVLGRHLHDPLPIPSTIRKTLGDFKRTHHDDWQNHKLKFTEDELCLLSDLAVPPSYYA